MMKLTFYLSQVFRNSPPWYGTVHYHPKGGTHGGDKGPMGGGIGVRFAKKSGGVSNKQKMCIKAGKNSYFDLYLVKH